MTARDDIVREAVDRIGAELHAQMEPWQRWSLLAATLADMLAEERAARAVLEHERDARDSDADDLRGR
jgi:hypothetical protein